MTSNELIKIGSNFLKKNNIKSHVIDSELILSSISGQLRENFLLNSNYKLSPKQIKSFNKLIYRRALGKEPVAYLLKKKEFWSINLDIDKGALIPRPETEILVETLVKFYKNQNPFILDIGTGSGCIIISLIKELKKSKGMAIDISNEAIRIAKNILPGKSECRVLVIMIIPCLNIYLSISKSRISSAFCQPGEPRGSAANARRAWI